MDLAAARARLIFALDVDDAPQAYALAERLADRVGWIKVGLRLFNAGGPDLVRRVAALGPRIFLDLKFHDIPDQVEGACRVAAGLGVGLLTVHAAGGRAMLQAAVRGAAAGAPGGQEAPGILAVTVLTSLDASDLRSTGVDRAVDAQVLGLATLAVDAGCRGVVSSPQELGALRASVPSTFGILCPGIRPAGSAHGDQKRVLGPREAIEAGATWIVVGRPIQQAPDPAVAADSIVEAIRAAG